MLFSPTTGKPKIDENIQVTYMHEPISNINFTVIITRM
jgi:NADPH-ferrihemoprotein reductase